MAYNHAIVRNYFAAFSNKDIDGLSSMFTDDVILKDWENSAQGRAVVLAVNKDIFDAVDTIEIKVINLAENPLNTLMFAEIEVIINNDVKLNVVDIIKFNNGKISEILAYKR